MTPLRTRTTVQLLLAVVLAISGTYVLVYLYRWQWNRALISAMFFVIAEVALATLTVLRRLHEIERRLPTTTGAAPRQDSTTAIDRSSPKGAASEAFRWLEPTGHGMAVFVPILMGVGVILSALAYLVDRVAALTTPASGSGAGRLGPLELPAETLLTPVDLSRALNPPRQAERTNRLRRVALVLLVVVAVTTLVDVVADATQTRPDHLLAGQITVVDLEVQHRRGRTALEAAEALWGAASMVIPRTTDLVSMRQVADDRVRLVLAPALGTHARKRLRGSLEDAAIDYVAADVLSMRTIDRPTG